MTRRITVAALVIATAAAVTSAGRAGESLRDVRALRVCADPNNLPFSNDKEEGFENTLARLLARDLNLPLEYMWWPLRRGFVRNTLDVGACDVIMGLPTGFERARTTRPYYRSSYVFVSLHSRHLGLSSLDDRRLARLRIGVQMIGDDFANSPPAHALSARGIVRNVVGYSVFGDYSQPNPPARIIDAVVKREVDAAIVWGPLAGFFAARAPQQLDIRPVSPQVDPTHLLFVFDISMAVRRQDSNLHQRLEQFISRRRGEIDRILAAFHIPRADRGKQES